MIWTWLAANGQVLAYIFAAFLAASTAYFVARAQNMIARQKVVTDLFTIRLEAIRKVLREIDSNKQSISSISGYEGLKGELPPSPVSHALHDALLEIKSLFGPKVGKACDNFRECCSDYTRALLTVRDKEKRPSQEEKRKALSLAMDMMAIRNRISSLAYAEIYVGDIQIRKPARWWHLW